MMALGLETRHGSWFPLDPNFSANNKETAIRLVKDLF
jgi:hypothetical protein